MYIRRYKYSIENELKTHCNAIINVLDKFLTPNAKSLDSKVS